MSVSDTERMRWEVELEKLQSLVARLEEGLRIEEEAEQIDLVRWGRFSHKWNRERQDLWDGTRAICTPHAPGHGIAHAAIGQLFDAWQGIHYSITRGKAPELDPLAGVKSMLEESKAALAAQNTAE